MEFSEAFSIVLTLVVVLQSFMISRQVDLSRVNELITVLKPKAKQTKNPFDDIGIAALEELVKRLSQPGDPIKGDEGGDNVGEYNENRGV